MHRPITPSVSLCLDYIDFAAKKKIYDHAKNHHYTLDTLPPLLEL